MHFRILLVDDQDSVLRSLYALLEGAGYDVLAARNGVDALTIFRQSIRPFELLVTDYNMPHMSGLALARGCSLLCSGLSVLYVSGSFPSEELKIELQAPKRDFLAKPFRADDLLRKVRGLLPVERTGYPQLVRPCNSRVDSSGESPSTNVKSGVKGIDVVPIASRVRLR